MGSQTRLEGLRVAVEFTDAVRRSVGVSWSPLQAAAPHTKLECARIFLVALDGDRRRTYLALADGPPRASVRLADGLADGEYAIEVHGYGSASWGDGKLDARGYSSSFTIAGTDVYRTRAGDTGTSSDNAGHRH